MLSEVGISVRTRASEEEALVTPGWELSQDFIPGYFNQHREPADKSTGIFLFRSGVRVTAFCCNPNAGLGKMMGAASYDTEWIFRVYWSVIFTFDYLSVKKDD